jgi:hypothetical protein
MGYNAAKTQAILDIMEKAEIWAAQPLIALLAVGWYR